MAASTESVDEDSGESLVDIWKRFPGLTNSHYWKEYMTRLKTGRDMHTMVTGASETGIGKTTLATVIPIIGDVNGWTAENGTLDPAEFSHLYDKKVLCSEHEHLNDIPLETFDACDECQYYLPPGSWLLGDEWEQAVDARRSSSKENVQASHDVATKRYRQIFAIYTLPSKSWMDGRFSSDAADYWIQAQQTEFGHPKGEAHVYRLKTNEHYETDYNKRVETISWPVIDDHPEFRKMKLKKRERMEGRLQRSYVHIDEFEEAKKNFWNKATKKTRYHLVKAMAEWGLSQPKISEILTIADNVEGLSQQRVSQLVNTESFEEAYEG